MFKAVDAEMFASFTCWTGSRRSGTFYTYDGNVINGRVRVAINPEYCGNTSIGKYMTEWVNKAE